MSEPTPHSGSTAPAASVWSVDRASPPPQPPSLSLSMEPSPAVPPAEPSAAVAALPASSALAQRTGQSLAHLIELTNAINTRRGSSIQHALPEGVETSGLLHAGRRGRQQAAARRGTWTAFGHRQEADSPANHAAAAGGAAVPVAQRFSSGATAARRFSAAVGMLHSAVAFSDESLSGLAAAKVIDAAETSPSRRHALLEAAKVRALTPSYARRGGGVLLSASVAGLDLQTGENAHLASAAPARAPSPTKVVARVVMEEDGLAADPTAPTPHLRTSRFASTYGMQTEMKRAIAQRQPKRAQRDSSFRQQLLHESALMIEGVKPETAAAAESTTAAATAPADASASQTSDRSALLSRRHRRSITAPDVPQVVTVRYDWRTVLSKPGSERTEAELTFLQGWISGLQISFFNGLSPEMLRLICKVVTLSSYAEGEWIFRQGEKGEHFFVILQGRVAIVIDKTLKIGEIAGQRDSDRLAMEARRERQAREAGLMMEGDTVTSVAAEAVQSMLLRSASTASNGARPLSASALQRSPTSPRPGSASNRKSLLSPASIAASRRTSMAPAVAEGSDNEEDHDADSASATPPITLLSLTPSPRKLGVHARKLVRAAKLIGSLTRAQQRVNPGGLALSTGGVLCAACGASGHTDAACPSKATLPSSPVPSGAATPNTATPARNRGSSAASSAIHSPLLTPQRSLAKLGSPRASGVAFTDQQQLLQPPSPSPRRSTLMPPTPREASNEVHSPSPSSAAAASKSSAAAGPALTHQQYSLGLVSTEAVVAEAGVGAGFGEVALASKTNTRQASVLVLPGHGSCVCLVLHKAAYDIALKMLHEAQLTYKLNFTRELFLFHRWSYEKALQFTACYTSAVPLHYPAGHIFYRQRQRADTVFFVVSGTVAVQFMEEGERSAALLRAPAAEDEGTPMEGRGRWIGATYIRDEAREAALVARAKQTKAEEAARLKALQLAQPKWLRRASVRDKRRKHKHDVSPRYLDPTGQSRLYTKPLSAREKDEARVLALAGEDVRKVPLLRVGRDAVGPLDAEGHSFWELERGSSADASDDSGFSSSSSSEGRSTDTSASDDDEWTISRRAERKRAKAQAKKARRRARRTGQHVEPVYDGMAQAELQASNDGCIATMPRDGATSYQFFKIFFQQDEKTATTTAEGKQEDERVLRITLKPQLSPAVADADGKVPAIAPHDQFDLFGGNDTCRYPSKTKHTWQASAVIGGNGVSTRARSIVIRPATDPNFQSGFVYVSVFHPLNEAAILAHQAAHKGHMPVAATGPQVQHGPAYELLVETVSAAAAGWPRGSLHTPPRVYELSTLGALDLFGAEEVIVQHEAALASIAAAAAAREGKPAPIGVAARETVNYTELGRISTAVVSSAGGARVLMMAREHFTNHVRGNMLAELKSLLRRQLLARAEILERQRTIVALTETKVPPPKRYDLKQLPKPTMPPQRPQSAHPLSTEAAASTAAAVTTPLLLGSAETAAFHHRPDLGSLTMLSQRERAQLEQAYQRGRDHARLKDAVLEQWYSRNPNAPPLALLEEEKSQGHELWALDKDERVQAQRRETLLLLQAEERAEQSLVFKESAGGAPLSTQLRLMPGSPSSGSSAKRPGTAPIRRAIKPEPQQPALMLMPGSDTSTGTMVASPASSDNLVPNEPVAPAAGSATAVARSADDLALAPTSLNDGSFQTMTRLEEKYAALTQQKLAKRLFGAADAAVLLSKSGSPPRRRTRSMSSATRDGPVFGMSGSSANAGTLSKKGAQMAVGQGLRNHWQRERTEVLFKAKLKADRQAHSAREHPFSDPSLTNPWMYLPSLYDSAAVDPQLNHLAIALGIPQPKPMSQPRDSARAHRPAVFSPDGKPVLDADAYEEQDQAQLMQRKQRAAGCKQVARKVSVEEALRIAEIKAAAAQGTAAPAAAEEEEKHEDHSTASKSRRASVNAAGPIACPVPDTLWQSERALLSDGSSASPTLAPRGRPFVAQTELAHLAHLVRFEPSQVSSPIPRKFKNKERTQRDEEKQAAPIAETQPLQLMAADASTADATVKPAAPSAPPSHRFHPSSRPSSASMFGSFARATPVPVAAAAAPVASSASPVSVAVDEGSGNASEEDVLSSIFSLTQVAPGGSQQATTRSRHEDTAMVLHASVDDRGHDSRRRSASRPASARAEVPRGNLFIAPAPIAPAVGIPQRQESPAEHAQKEAVKAYLREQTAGLSLAARIAESARTLSGASSARPQSARAVLRSTRQAHSARRPHVPPSIPHKTRPDAHTLEQSSYLAILQRKQSAAQEQLAKIRAAGQRRWMREANKQQRREQQEADDDDAAAAAAAAASRPMSAVSAVAASAASAAPAPALYWHNQPVSGAFEAQLRADWDRVDVHEEGERAVASEAVRTFIEAEDADADAEEQQRADQPAPLPPRRPAPPTHSRPASASFIMHGASPSPMHPGVARPTSAFPRPPSAHAASVRRSHIRPQSALSGQ